MKWPACFLLFFVLGFVACQQGEVEKELVKADALRIEFFDNGNRDSIDRIFTTNDRTAIEKLARFADGKAANPVKCSYDGMIYFLKDTVKLFEVEFNRQPECNHFSFMYQGKLLTTKMSNEALAFLQALQQERKAY